MNNRPPSAVHHQDLIPRSAHQEQQGLTLLELMLSLSLGLMLSMGIMQVLLSQQRIASMLARLSREKAELRSTLQLIRGEVLRADRVEWRDGFWSPASCSLSGRRIALQILVPEGTITYSIGQPPSNIWRDSVLMRCGPAYGLDGSLGTATSQNRVLLDGLTTEGLLAQSQEMGIITLTLKRFTRNFSSGQTTTTFKLLTPN